MLHISCIQRPQSRCPLPRRLATTHPSWDLLNDDIYLDITDWARFKQATAAIIEAVFILLGKPDLTLCQDPISWDKLLELTITPGDHVLGLVLDLHCLTIGAPPDLIAAMVHFLRTTWGPYSHSFRTH